MKVLDIGDKYGYTCYNIFYPQDVQLARYSNEKTIKDNLEGVDLVIFGGGADVNPRLYNHKNVGSHCSDELSDRDRFEAEVFAVTRRKGVKTLGICRGAQFLCAMTGGWLVQHADGHATGGSHTVHSEYGTVEMNSYHHQIMVPSDNSVILGYTVSLSKRYIYDVEGAEKQLTQRSRAIDPEIVLFDRLAFGIQSHPEYLDRTDPSSVFSRELLNKYFKLGVKE